MRKSPPDALILFTGILFSLFMVLALPDAYFHKDLEVFGKWTQNWNSGWQNIYINCPDCNYPILGMFGSAGLMSWLGSSGSQAPVFTFRILLALLDGINIYLLFWIMRRLQVEKAAYLAGLIGISISSWAGAALWGQIDGISQLLLLLTLGWVVKKNTTDQSTTINYWLYLIISAFLLGTMLLTKQLSIFSAFSIGLLLIADIAFHNRSLKTFLACTVVGGATFLVALFAWDPFLALKPPYFSHLLYIWQEGIFQQGIISGNGFNIWMLSGQDMWSSAQVPFTSISPFFTPYRVGQLLFLLLTGLSTLSLFLWLSQKYKLQEKQLDREILLNFILHLALTNLCFNVFLTGTRERYLLHFYPTILLAWAGLIGFSPLFTKKMRSLLFFCANLYGLFVLQILSSFDFHTGTSTHLFMTVLHLGLYISLLIIVLKYQQLAKNTRLFFGKKTYLPFGR
ncbi:MAG: hypothetical protein WCK35_27955 [Chloroflexota bacterium]